MVCINRRFCGTKSRWFEHDGSGPLVEHPDAVPTEYFEYDGSDIDRDVALFSAQIRHYDPAEGRWLSEDPIGFEGGDPNLHRYPGNAPE